MGILKTSLKTFRNWLCEYPDPPKECLCILDLYDLWLSNYFPTTEDKPEHKEVKLSANAPEFSPIITSTIIHTNTLRWFKNFKTWRDKLKNREIIIRTSKYAETKAIFKSWHGTVCDILIDDRIVKLSIEHKVSVFCYDKVDLESENFESASVDKPEMLSDIAGLDIVKNCMEYIIYQLSHSKGISTLISNNKDNPIRATTLEIVRGVLYENIDVEVSQVLDVIAVLKSCCDHMTNKASGVILDTLRNYILCVDDSEGAEDTTIGARIPRIEHPRQLPGLRR